MKLKSSFLLAGVAALFATATHAADVHVDGLEAAPTPLSVPDYGSGVSVCDAMGAGFFVLPGTETCLKIGGAVESRVGYAKLFDGLLMKDAFAGIEARLDMDTRSDSELGVIGSKFRLSLEAGFNSDADDTDIGVELAYLTVGPAYVGFKETLFNTKFGYGDLFDADSFLGGLNTLTAGGMVEDIGGSGFYVGGGIEHSQRGRWIASYDGAEDVDFVARFGIADQPWGSSDVSVLYSKFFDSWGIKSTTDLNVLEGTDVRLTAAYADLSGVDLGYLGAGVQHGFTDDLKAYGSVGYAYAKGTTVGGGFFLPISIKDDAWLANAGVTYTLIENFDVTGEIGYGRSVGTDSWIGQLKFVRSW